MADRKPRGERIREAGRTDLVLRPFDVVLHAFKRRGAGFEVEHEICHLLELQGVT